jgi:hypothetical protein
MLWPFLHAKISMVLDPASSGTQETLSGVVGRWRLGIHNLS